MVIGDSTAQGVGASNFRRGWVGQLDEIFKKSGKHYRIINLSISRARVEDALEKQFPVMEKLGQKPELVTCLIGLNNLPRKRLRMNLNEGLMQVIQRLPKGAVIGTLPGHPPSVGKYNELIRKEAKKKGLKVAEITEALTPPYREKYASDHYHPNDKGYADYAAAFAKALGLK